MQFNQACVRDIMLFLESNLKCGKSLTPIKIFRGMRNNDDNFSYDKKEITFYIDLLIHEKYLLSHKERIRGAHQNNLFMTYIDGMTEKGFTLCANIKPKSVWEKIKSRADINTISSLFSAAASFVGMIR